MKVERDVCTFIFECRVFLKFAYSRPLKKSTVGVDVSHR